MNESKPIYLNSPRHRNVTEKVVWRLRLMGFEVNCLFCPFFVTSDQAADDHVKIKITKYKTGSSPDGEVKVQEMGEGDPQWQHIKDVVKEQLEKAGLKAEGMKGQCGYTHSLLSFPSPVFSFIAICLLLSYLYIFYKNFPEQFCHENGDKSSLCFFKREIDCSCMPELI